MNDDERAQLITQKLAPLLVQAIGNMLGGSVGGAAVQTFVRNAPAATFAALQQPVLVNVANPKDDGKTVVKAQTSLAQLMVDLNENLEDVAEELAELNRNLRAANKKKAPKKGKRSGP